MSKDISHQKEYLQKVKKLCTALINYKQTRDKAKLYYDEIAGLKEEVLNYGLAHGQSTEMVIQLVYDMTKNLLSEWYVRKLFSGELNRRILQTNTEDSDNEDKKDTVKYSNDMIVPAKGNTGYSNKDISARIIHDRDLPPDEVEVTFDLKQASRMGLKDAIQKCDKSNTESYLITIRFKDYLVTRIENEITGLVWEEFTK